MAGILLSVLIGAIAGFIASKITKKGMGLLICILVGIIGGFLGSWIFSLLGLAPKTTFWGQLLVGTVGSVVLIWVLSLFKKK
jgi:uncharacterized membrane protein YeaQ/YmgE (transglycosylase-associated protein family)